MEIEMEEQQHDYIHGKKKDIWAPSLFFSRKLKDLK